MKKWAEIHGGKIRCIFETPDNFTPVFAAPIVAMEITGMDPEPKDGWALIDGVLIPAVEDAGYVVTIEWETATVVTGDPAGVFFRAEITDSEKPAEKYAGPVIMQFGNEIYSWRAWRGAFCGIISTRQPAGRPAVSVGRINNKNVTVVSTDIMILTK